MNRSGWRNRFSRVRRYAFEVSCVLFCVLAAAVVYGVVLLAPGAMA